MGTNKRLAVLSEGSCSVSHEQLESVVSGGPSTPGTHRREAGMQLSWDRAPGPATVSWVRSKPQAQAQHERWAFGAPGVHLDENFSDLGNMEQST